MKQNFIFLSLFIVYLQLLDAPRFVLALRFFVLKEGMEAVILKRNPLYLQSQRGGM